MSRRWHVPIAVAAALGLSWISESVPMISQPLAGVVILGFAVVWAGYPSAQRRWSCIPGAYKLPGEDDLEVQELQLDEDDLGSRYRITVTVRNPGHADTFEVQFLDLVEGDADGLVEFLRWQGEDGQKRKISKDQPARLNVGYWEPMGEGWLQNDEEIRPGKLTVMSSTGEVEVYQPREDVTSTADLPDNPIKFVLSLRSETTEKDRQFLVSVAPASISNLEPEVDLTAL